MNFRYETRPSGTLRNPIIDETVRRGKRIEDRYAEIDLIPRHQSRPETAIVLSVERGTLDRAARSIDYLRQLL